MEAGAAAAAAAAVPGPAPTTAQQDSGVETEGDQESNDSSLSSVSLGNPQAPVQAQPTFSMPASPTSAPTAAASSSSSRATPEVPAFARPFANNFQPPPSVTEDGYLGDCSSDGGNEKNFPMPAHLLKRLVKNGNKSCPCHPEQLQSSAAVNSNEVVEPPAGLSFQNLSQVDQSGYQVKAESRKMKSSMKLKTNPRFAGLGKAASNSWSHISTTLTERKLRTAASTNNTEMMYNLIAKGVNVNAPDEQQRTALHFSAAKGYSEVVNLLLQYGADPNAKDVLGNTALHLAACTNHIEVVTLLLRGGTDVTTLDNSGRTPMQLAQSKLKLLQKNSSKSVSEMNKVKAEVSQVVDMMREYLSKKGAMKDNYSQLLNSFSQRLQLHNNHHEIHSDLQNLLDTLGNLHIDKT